MNQTVLALLTPPGRAAIATLGLSGPLAWSAVQRLFRPYGSTETFLPDHPEPDSFWVGRMGDANHGFDEIVLSVPTTEPAPRVEIHCHGGIEVVQLLKNLLTQLGIRECTWQEFLRLNASDHLQAEAAIALARAPTARTAAILLDQYHGTFREAVEAAAADLRTGKHDAAVARIAALVENADLGRHLTEPWHVVIAGAPNVGKSSLVNALAGFQRSIVSPLPGTTRDVVTTMLAIDGWPIELMDTAGWRSEAEPIEQEGILRAQLAAGNADLCLWLLDASTPPVFPAQTDQRFRMVVNKVDLAPVWDIGSVNLQVSVETGLGLDELCRLIADALVPAPPAPGTPIPFTPALCQMIEQAAELGRCGKLPEMLEVLQAVLQPVNHGSDTPTRSYPE